MVSLVDLPVLVVEYSKALSDPRQWVDELATFLNHNGITPGADSIEDTARVLDGDLRHHRTTSASASLEIDQQPLLEILRDRLGAHERWSMPELPPEPGWVSDVISLTWSGQAVAAALKSTQEELKWLKKSRLFRMTNAVWRVTGTGPLLSPAKEGAESSNPGTNGGGASAPVSW
jgi:hypothetical protein